MKKIFILTLVALGVAAASVRPASAAVVIGGSIGPVYGSYSSPGYYSGSYGYPRPAYGYAYPYCPPPVAYAPAYVAPPVVTFGFNFGGGYPYYGHRYYGHGHRHHGHHGHGYKSYGHHGGHHRGHHGHHGRW